MKTESIVRAWHDGPLPTGVKAAADRLAGSDGVRRVALMPDAHLSDEVCIGTVAGTRDPLYPGAVGGDIGCGVAAMAFEPEAERVTHAKMAARLLAGLYEDIPFVRHRRKDAPPLPEALAAPTLSSPALERVRRREAEPQLGTLGSGNHFLELQSDEDGRLWVMLHSGSRGLGQAVRDHHLARCRVRTSRPALPRRRIPRGPRLSRGHGLGAGLRRRQPPADDGRRRSRSSIARRRSPPCPPRT